MNAAKKLNVRTVARSEITGVILGFSLVTGALVVRDIKFMVGKLSCLFSLFRD